MIDKYELRISYKKDMNVFFINTDATVDKLFKLVEIYYEDVENTNYRLLYNDVELKKYRLKLLSEVFVGVKNGGEVIELCLYEEDEIANNIIVECCIVKEKVIDSRTFRVGRKLNFQKLK